MGLRLGLLKLGLSFGVKVKVNIWGWCRLIDAGRIIRGSVGCPSVRLSVPSSCFAAAWAQAADIDR